mmetsp:Transcript_26123/g.39139  ORF Transcript_26123/g.39139 Transcript_26123/m.39139 type:complete len:115 (-) Transcript_26123:1039-1383(-)
MDTIRAAEFYSEYHGHKVEHLQKLLPHLRQSTSTSPSTSPSAPRNLIWTAGDSSLDNKYWFGSKANAVGAYRDVLRPRESICDVTYWLNYVAKKRLDEGKSENDIAAINTAGEY